MTRPAAWSFRYSSTHTREIRFAREGAEGGLHSEDVGEKVTMRRLLEMKAMKRAPLFLLLTLALACGCGGSKSTSASIDQPSVLSDGSSVGSINVARGAQMPEGDHTEQFDKYSAASALQGQLTSVLRESGQFAEDGPIVVDVTITDFRLRSGASTFWLGFMAGADYIKADVTALRGGATIKTFSTDTSTALGGAANTSPTRRTTRLINSLAKRIAKGL